MSKTENLTKKYVAYGIRCDGKNGEKGFLVSVAWNISRGDMEAPLLFATFTEASKSLKKHQKVYKQDKMIVVPVRVKVIEDERSKLDQ